MRICSTSKSPELRHRGSLMTYEAGGCECCLGYLMEFPGRGVYEPTFGKLEVTAEEARAHNQCLSEGEIAGLDQNCTVGMRGRFYVRRDNEHTVVTTWIGQEVSREVQLRGQTLTFTRLGRHFRGRLRRDNDSLKFQRIH